MTDQPPPGTYPPPPPPQGGYPPPPGQGGGYPPPPQAGPGFAPPKAGQGLPQDAYTPWLTRVLAWLIDYIPVAFLTAIGVVCLTAMQKVETVCITDDSELQLGEFCATGNNGPSTAAWIIFAVCMLAALAYGIWNYGLRQGTTGSSVGKSMMKFKVVSESTGQPIGFGPSIVRQIAHAIDSAICYIGYLFPLWDAKRQTIADKLLKTVCLPT
jgi:uncharacterized RDD family membrane protein YckC